MVEALARTTVILPHADFLLVDSSRKIRPFNLRELGWSAPMEGGCPMKKSKFTEQQIAFAFQQAEGGTQVAEYAGRWAAPKRRSIACSSSTAA